MTLTIFGTSPKDPAGETSARIFSTFGNIKQKEIFRVIIQSLAVAIVLHDPLQKERKKFLPLVAMRI